MSASSTGESTAVQGFVAPGFERVVEEFERNFTDRGDGGAAFAAVLDGQLVVDLWGGVAHAAEGAAWQRDTLQLVFSGTKGLVAVCLLLLLDRHELALEAPVSRYWPEFGANGKRDITVAELVSHRPRLPGIRTPLREEDLTDDVRMAALLAAQAPERDPRAQRAYHPLTFGWLCGELVRRVSGRSVGRFFDEEVARPLGLEIWIGLPEQQEPRVSTLTYGHDWGASPQFDGAALAADDLIASVWANPVLFPPERMPWNLRELHAAEIPAVNGIGTARSIALLYGCLARGGEIGTTRLLSRAAIELGRRELSRFEDFCSGEPLAFGVGFQLQTELMRYGPPPDAYGHAGAGGSVHAAWPGLGVGVSYVTNQMRDDPAGDPRPRALLAALHETLAGRSTP